tara:strand:- start:242 stop:877 length:636 start_codon:yes stop_codon:yes gene_type:complete
MSTFTIITGSGRCGTSALSKFFIESRKVDMHFTNEIPDIRAGYENLDSIKANSLISDIIIPTFSFYESNNINKGIDLIKKVTRDNHVVKTPSFFFYNTYDVWKKYNTKDELLVILLKRDKLENVFKSAAKISWSKEWEYFKDVQHLENHYLENIKNLENNNIRYIELEFPKFILDPEYLYSKLLTSDFNFTKEMVLELSNKVFQESQITIK